MPIAGATLLDWRILAAQRFSILAKAWFSQGGTTAVQLTNFTAEPMSRLYEQIFYCDMSRLYDDFGGYCCRYAAGFDDVTLRFITTSRDSAAYVDTKNGNPTPSVYTEGNNGYGGAFLNLSSWIGGLPATEDFSIQCFLQTALTGTDYMQLNFFIDTNSDGRSDIEVVYYNPLTEEVLYASPLGSTATTSPVPLCCTPPCRRPVDNGLRGLFQKFTTTA